MAIEVVDVDIEADEEEVTPAQLVSPASVGWSPNVMTYLRKPQAKTKKKEQA